MIDWALTIPNFTVEWDLPISKPHFFENNLTLSLTARYNWNASNTRLPYNVFNIMQIRPEVRYYWHPNSDDETISFKERREKYNPTDADKEMAQEQWEEVNKDKKWADLTIKQKERLYDEQVEIRMQKSFFEGWFEQVILFKKVPGPKIQRTYFAGPYMDAGTYSLKLGKYGYQGQLYTLGVTAGYVVPRYQYSLKSKYVDVEFGFSVGLALYTADTYVLDGNANRYVHAAEESKAGLRLAPFPILSQLNLSFAWRNTTIKDKYKISEKAKIAWQGREAVKSKKAAEKAVKALKTEVEDSLKSAKSAAKAAAQSAKLAAQLAEDSAECAAEAEVAAAAAAEAEIAFKEAEEAEDGLKEVDSQDTIKLILDAVKAATERTTSAATRAATSAQNAKTIIEKKESEDKSESEKEQNEVEINEKEK